MAVDKHGTIWVGLGLSPNDGNPTGIMKIVGDKWQYIPYSSISLLASADHATVECVDKDNNLWLSPFNWGNGPPMVRYDGTSWTAEDAYTIHCDSSGTAWNVKESFNNTTGGPSALDVTNTVAYWDHGTWRSVDVSAITWRILSLDVYRTTLILGTLKGVAFVDGIGADGTGGTSGTGGATDFGAGGTGGTRSSPDAGVDQAADLPRADAQADSAIDFSVCPCTGGTCPTLEVLNQVLVTPSKTGGMRAPVPSTVEDAVPFYNMQIGCGRRVVYLTGGTGPGYGYAFNLTSGALLGAYLFNDVPFSACSLFSYRWGDTSYLSGFMQGGMICPDKVECSANGDRAVYANWTCPTP